MIPKIDYSEAIIVGVPGPPALAIIAIDPHPTGTPFATWRVWTHERVGYTRAYYGEGFDLPSHVRRVFRNRMRSFAPMP
ncbi:MAG: hypothetical protein FJ399_00460 [Verrucomicrobia bacterium]|nr:hypothetical protein [Verrucomicrobiota bacterium]